MATLLKTINHHIKAIYRDAELSLKATIRRYRIVQTERLSKKATFQNIRFIMSIMTIRNRIVMTPPARMKSGTR